MKKTILMAVMVLVTATVAYRPEAREVALDVPSGTYEMDKTHAYILFSYSHLGLSFPVVRFNDFDVDLNFDAQDPSKSSLMVTIEAASVDSGVEKLDDHLKSADFFDAAAYPRMTFKATSIEVTGENTGRVMGDLTIKEVSKPVTLDVTLNKAFQHPMKNKPALGFSATGRLKRSDWGLDKYVPVVSDEVTLRIEAEFIQ